MTSAEPLAGHPSGQQLAIIKSNWPTLAGTVRQTDTVIFCFRLSSRLNVLSSFSLTVQSSAVVQQNLGHILNLLDKLSSNLYMFIPHNIMSSWFVLTFALYLMARLAKIVSENIYFEHCRLIFYVSH